MKDALLKEGVQIGSYPTEFFHPIGTPILDLNSSQYHSIPGTPFGSQISSSSLFESNGSIVSSKEPLDDLSMRSKANHQRSNYEIYQPKPKFNIYNYSLVIFTTNKKKKKKFKLSSKRMKQMIYCLKNGKQKSHKEFQIFLVSLCFWNNLLH